MENCRLSFRISSCFIWTQDSFFATIEAVESFVEDHYEEQLVYLRSQNNPNQSLINLLQSCQDDEIEHKIESGHKKNLSSGFFLNLWVKIVGGGSAFAVRVAKVI